MGAGDVDVAGARAGGARSVSAARAARGRAARLPARAPDDGAHGRRGGVLRARGQRGASCSSCSRGPRDGGVPVSVVGSGSNLLVADEGVRGPRRSSSTASSASISLDGRAIAVRRRRAPAGGGGARGARGPVGDRVRREHPGHGRRRGADERQRLRRRAGRGARVGRDRDRRGRASAARRASSGFGYRSSSLARRRDRRARRPAAARRRTPDAVKATLAEMRRRRHEAQPQGIKTFGSTFKNPEDPRARGAQRRAAASRGRLQRPGGRRRALRAQARELHREHGRRRRTADVVAVMAEGRRRVLERFGVELEPEVQTLGDVRFPWRAVGVPGQRSKTS